MNYQTDYPHLKVTEDSFITHKLDIIYFRLLVEGEIALFLNEIWGRVRSMKNWQGIPTTRLTSGNDPTR